MAIELYYADILAPCRMVLLVAAALDIQLDLKPMNIKEGDQFRPEFVLINPQHTLPTIVDGDFALWESRAISRYLVNQYAKGSSLYPEDPKERALVDQRLDFDLGTLYSSFFDYYWPQFFSGVKADRSKLRGLKDALIFLNTFLEGRTYAAGPGITLADLSLVATVSTIEATEILDLRAYPNIMRWYTLIKATAKDYHVANGEGIKTFRKLIEPLKYRIEL